MTMNAHANRRAPSRFLSLTAGAAALAVVLGARDAHAAKPTAEEVAGRVQKFYDGTKTFRATFKQVYFIKVQNKKKESKGKVVFEKPGKMSFSYDTPNGNRVVSDGKVIKVVNGATHVARPEYNRSIEKPLKDYFDRYHTVRMENFRLSDEEIIDGGRGEIIVQPTRARAVS